MIVPLVKISVILDPYFGEVGTQKLPKKGHFIDAESVRKTLKNFNLATLNTKSVNRKALKARNSDFRLNF